MLQVDITRQENQDRARRRGHCKVSKHTFMLEQRYIPASLYTIFSTFPYRIVADKISCFLPLFECIFVDNDDISIIKKF